jgi:rhodanese-related sulfurtransferase
MTIQTIDPSKAQELIANGAEVIDIREADEHRRERIAGSRNAPLSGIAPDNIVSHHETVIFHCKSGMRTHSCIAMLSKVTTGRAYIMAGGLDGWKKQGLAVQVEARQPIELMRQVQIAAGGLALAGALLGVFVLALGV